MAEIFGNVSRRSLEVVEADLANPAVIESNIKRHGSTIDTVIHCAGETTFSAGERESARTVQIDGPLALIEMLRPGVLRCWVYISTPLEMRMARMLSPYRDYLQQDVQFDDSTARRLLGRHRVEPLVIDVREPERFLKLAWFSGRYGPTPAAHGSATQVETPTNHLVRGF